jgi:hypothetical protein
VRTGGGLLWRATTSRKKFNVKSYLKFLIGEGGCSFPGTWK